MKSIKALSSADKLFTCKVYIKSENPCYLQLITFFVKIREKNVLPNRATTNLLHLTDSHL